MKRLTVMLVIVASSLSGLGTPAHAQKISWLPTSTEEGRRAFRAARARESAEQFMKQNSKKPALVRLIGGKEIKGRIIELQDSDLVIEQRKGGKRNVVSYTEITEGPKTFIPLGELIVLDTVLVIIIIPFLPLFLIAGGMGMD